MVILYSGTPGSGKSLHCAYEILDQLKFGRNVVANFPIDLGYFDKHPQKRKLGKFQYISNSKLTPHVLKCFAKKYHKPFKENESLLVIDECGILFNPRSSKEQAKGRMQWLEFFSQHRKLGYNILLISQSDKMIDSQIRVQIEEEHRHRAIKNYKVFGYIISALFGGLFADITFWYPCRLKTGSKFFNYCAEKAKIYDTYLIFE